jgi:uncharacterized membrane protein YkvA (DUF1232 family)
VGADRSRRRAEVAGLERLRAWARGLKRDAHAVWLCARDPRTPWYVKALALAVAGYAFSPIDLIPDFIPVLGYLDDLILVPAGLWLVLRLIPAEVLATHRATAEAAAERPVSRVAMIAVIGVWIVLGLAILLWISN